MAFLLFSKICFFSEIALKSDLTTATIASNTINRDFTINVYKTCQNNAIVDNIWVVTQYKCGLYFSCI